MVLAFSDKNPLGEKASAFSLPGVDNKITSLDDYKNSYLVVIMFICNHCPYVKAVLDRLIQLQNAYDSRDVRLIGISSNDVTTYPEDSFEMMQMIAADKNFNFPYLYDKTQEVAKAYGAVCTPDFYILDKDRKIAYRGRLDDNWRDETKVKVKDLQMALEHLLKDQEIPFKQIPSMGCSIKWKN